MSIDVTLPDGTVIKGVPDGTTKAQLAEKLRAKGYNVPDAWLSGSRASPLASRPRPGTPEWKAQEEANYQKTQDEMVANMSTGERLAVGAGKAIYDTGRGLGQILGKVSKEDVARAREQDAALMRTKAGVTGNVLGYVGEAIPATLLAPEATGAAGVVGTALLPRILAGGISGGAQGYAAPYASQREHVVNTLLGAGLGTAIPGAGAAASNVMRGLATPEAKTLMQAGVRLTPGQMLGGMAKTIEDKATSIPIVGDAIARAQRRALNDFNLASVNKALAPINAKLGKTIQAGYDAISEARDLISREYDQVLGQMKGRVDAQLTNRIASTLSSNINTLPEHLARKLSQTVDETVLQKLGTGQPVGGKTVKEVISSLGNEIRAANQSVDPALRQYGQALSHVQTDVKAMLKRQNPGKLAEDLKNTDAAHARMLRVENAAARVGSQEGKFTPAALRSAVRAEDASYKKRGFSQGNALMQDLADAGQATLPSKVADSGTAGRYLLDSMILGGGAATGHLPAVIAAGAAAHAAYSRPAQWLFERALAPKQNAVTNYLAKLAQQRLGNPANALVSRPFLAPNAPPPVPQQIPQVPQQ
jgi:hypothetical protein